MVGEHTQPKMRLRGLPRELTCGNVELVPAKDCPFSSNFQTCVSCEFTPVKYFRPDCGHIHCESCLVFLDSSTDELPDSAVQCTVCGEPRSAKMEQTSPVSLYMARFECPCGEEGNLHQLSRHRRSCRQSQRRKVDDLNESHASSASSASSSSMASSASTSRTAVLKANLPDPEMAKPFEFIVKGYIAQELNRLKEDVLNTTRVERQASEVVLQRLRDRLDYMDSRLDYTSRLDGRLERLESVAQSSHTVQQLASRIDALDFQVQELRDDDALDSTNDLDSMEQFVRLQSKCSFIWFDVKTLLRDFNRSRVVSSTEDQTRVVAGYPCKLHLQIEYDSGVKTLVLYIGCCEDVSYSANWPMRRQFSFRIFDGRGQFMFENQFSTIEPSCRDYFKGPGTPNFGTYFGIDMCSIEELTAESYYQRNNGMICLGIEVNPCSGGGQDL